MARPGKTGHDTASFQELAITNRLGASLIWDTVLRARGRGSKGKHANQMEQAQQHTSGAEDGAMNSFLSAPDATSLASHLDQMSLEIPPSQDLMGAIWTMWDGGIDSLGYDINRSRQFGTVALPVLNPKLWIEQARE
ncbi:Uu.00g002010.m01.CDS01 [Anthostomella pinea]|uniref:Uu.00g002010.m01.CDS01 n=1 Tax=Anthostomella pinea TaxID=933095 RepID=A0AAI8VK73_9PEZI|nr:Uu.00g002010.m01.CDS01 [Anthostomella pinea]